MCVKFDGLALVQDAKLMYEISLFVGHGNLSLTPICSMIWVVRRNYCYPPQIGSILESEKCSLSL